MKQHERRLAAAAYDQGPPDAPRCPGDRTVFVGVPTLGRTILCDLALANDPPETLALAVAETLALLRVMWVALLRRDEPDRRHLDAFHTALQCELAATEWMWSGGSGDGHALARTLARRREDHRVMLATPPPLGLGLLLPRSARANEPLPERLATAWAVLEREAASAGHARAARLREEAHDTVGAWRLGELEATDAAAVLQAACGHAAASRSSPVLVAAELPALRAAS